MSLKILASLTCPQKSSEKGFQHSTTELGRFSKSFSRLKQKGRIQESSPVANQSALLKQSALLHWWCVRLMTALAKSTEVLQHVGMPFILETIMLHKIKLRKKIRRRKKTTHHTSFPNQKNSGVLHRFLLASGISSRIGPGLSIALKKFQYYLASLTHNFRN